MPAKSPAQARLMAAVAHNPKFAAKVGIPQSVGREFSGGDELKKQAHMAYQLRNPNSQRRGY